MKEPRFSLSAILTLALGIGSTTLVFSLVYNLLFQPFVYRNFKRSTVFQIHDISETGSEGRRLLSLLEFLAFRQENHVFEDLVGYNNTVAISYTDGSGTREILGTGGSDSHAGAGGAYVATNTFDYSVYASLRAWNHAARREPRRSASLRDELQAVDGNVRR